VQIPGALHAVFVRSIMPHARLDGIAGLEDARAMPGVAAVLTAGDLDLPPMPPSGNVESPEHTDLAEPWGRHPLARDRLRFAGEPFAVVLADTMAHGLDASELR